MFSNKTLIYLQEQSKFINSKISESFLIVAEKQVNTTIIKSTEKANTKNCSGSR